jgi:hypothetical protein
MFNSFLNRDTLLIALVILLCVFMIYLFMELRWIKTSMTEGDEPAEDQMIPMEEEEPVNDEVANKE